MPEKMPYRMSECDIYIYIIYVYVKQVIHITFHMFCVYIVNTVYILYLHYLYIHIAIYYL